MTKSITNSISSKFYWLFVVLGLTAYIAVAVPYLLMLVHNSDLYYAAPNQTIGAGYALMPVIIGVVAAVLTRRRGIARAWFAITAGLVWLLAWTLLLGVGSLIAPSYYETVNNICLAVATLGVGGVLWLDRRTRQPQGRLRNWRVLLMASFTGVLLLTPLADTVVRSLRGQDGASDAVSFLSVYGVVLVAVLLTMLIFRRLPAIEVTKRVLLLFGLIMIGGVTVGFLTSILPTGGSNTIAGSMFVPLATFAGLFAVGAWLLRPVHQNVDA